VDFTFSTVDFNIKISKWLLILFYHSEVLSVFDSGCTLPFLGNVKSRYCSYSYVKFKCKREDKISCSLATALISDPVYPVNNPAGCYANGQIQAHGDRWREDDCTFCQCINGDPHCVATACGQSCLNPVKVPGECCPVCEGESVMSFLMLRSVIAAAHLSVPGLIQNSGGLVEVAGTALPVTE